MRCFNSNYIFIKNDPNHISIFSVSKNGCNHISKPNLSKKNYNR